MADGHVDLTGRWYPNSAGRMLQVAYPVDPAAFFHFDPKVTPEPPPSFNPGVEENTGSRWPIPENAIRPALLPQRSSNWVNTLPWN